MIHYMFDEPLDYTYYEGELKFYQLSRCFYGIPSNPGTILFIYCPKMVKLQ